MYTLAFPRDFAPPHKIKFLAHHQLEKSSLLLEKSVLICGEKLVTPTELLRCAQFITSTTFSRE